MKTPDDTKATFYIDIDQTIIDSKGMAYPNAIECIKKLSQKVNIFIWSAGGFNYANQIVENFDLTNYICGALPKPDYTIDDLKIYTEFSQNIFPNWKFIKSFETMLEGKFAEDVRLL